MSPRKGRRFKSYFNSHDYQIVSWATESYIEFSHTNFFSRGGKHNFGPSAEIGKIISKIVIISGVLQTVTSFRTAGSNILVCVSDSNQIWIVLRHLDLLLQSSIRVNWQFTFHRQMPLQLVTMCTIDPRAVYFIPIVIIVMCDVLCFCSDKTYRKWVVIKNRQQVLCFRQMYLISRWYFNLTVLRDGQRNALPPARH